MCPKQIPHPTDFQLNLIAAWPLQRDDADPRAASLLHLLALLPLLPQPPQHLLLENVPGFKVSRCAERWRAVLTDAGR